MSEFVFWGSDMERFALCESGSQIKTLPHPPGAHIRGGVLQKASLGHKFAGLFEGLISDGAFLCSEFYVSWYKIRFQCIC